MEAITFILLGIIVVLIGVIYYLYWNRDGLRRTRQFFLKYANIEGTEYRTVTVSNAVLQAIQSQQNFTGQEEQESARSEETNTLRLAYQMVTTGMNTECAPNLDLLGKSETNYSSDLDFLKVFEGKKCKCPSGQGWCNWGARMFDRFIVDNRLWDLVSIEIINCESNQVISSSIIGRDTSTPDGNYSVVEMSDPDAVKALPPQTLVKVVFTWRQETDGVVEFCQTTLINVMPNENTSGNFATNTQSNVVEIKKKKLA